MKRQRPDDAVVNESAAKHTKNPNARDITGSSQAFSFHRTGIDAYARHKELVNHYMLYCSGVESLQRDRSRAQRDGDVIRNHHQFLWDENETPVSWEQRLAKKYYEKLFKEYCLADLKLYKENKIGLRWRTEKEVVSGKGQFVCGNKVCQEENHLKSWEVNFAYSEKGIKKNTLVKLRLCEKCSMKLNYHKRYKESEPRHKKKDAGNTEEIESVTIKQEKDEDSPSTAPASSTTAEPETSLWSGNVVQDEDKARSEELEDYINDLLL